MRYTIYPAEGEPLKQCTTAQHVADNVQPGNVSHDSTPGCAYPYVAWRLDSLGMLGTPYATSTEAFTVARSQA